jgi:hypothetical protein
MSYAYDQQQYPSGFNGGPPDARPVRQQGNHSSAPYDNNHVENGVPSGVTLHRKRTRMTRPERYGATLFALFWSCSADFCRYSFFFFSLFFWWCVGKEQYDDHAWWLQTRLVL